MTVALEEVQDNPARYARQLERAKVSSGYAVCRCTTGAGGDPLRLVVRRYGALFHLARWPDEGPRHDAQSCSFYAAGPSADSANPDSLDAIRQTPAGLNVKLDASLAVRTVEPVPRSASNLSGAGPTRRCAPFLGFLQRVWLEAGLNVWTGAPARSWGQCNAQLLAALGDGKLNGKPMQDVLHVMRRYDESEGPSIVAEFDRFLARITTTPEATQRGIVITEVRSVDNSKFGFVLRLRQTSRTLFASKAIIDAASKSFRSAWAQIGAPTARVVALAVNERTLGKGDKEGNLRIVDVALQLCNSTFIPCDSSYEVAMANRLVAERRRFKKPLRLMPGDDTLPDSRLTDTSTPTAIEVYGMLDNAQYLARKTQKQAIYARAATPCVEWIPPAALESIRLPVAAP
ncbi:DUF1173 family protein [Caballeronia temeraria]|uniref:DUF1173 family protein n=1 Tax=Caballeronia temeraria TaxID=1777137 RepID=UPI000772C7A3|nr:DUF1173 family protein [Caballeronia temeraria]